MMISPRKRFHTTANGASSKFWNRWSTHSHWETFDRSAITPVSSEHVDGISSPERKHREAMEYAEDDEPEQIVEEEVLEASAQIPNIPVPRSSDGNVCNLCLTLGYLSHIW